MRALCYDRFGPADDVLEIRDLPTPTPGPGEVLVRVHASGINPSDVKLRAGARPGAVMAYPTIVPHSDGAGVIEAVGEGVDPARIGARVWIWNAQWQRQFGTGAEHITIASAQASDLPEAASFADGACLGIPAMTAWMCVLGDGPVEDKTLLITGGAGAVGRYAIQMARLSGATVITTVSSEAKAAHAGPADHIINYRTEDVAARIMEITEGQGVDRIVEVDFGANLPVTEQVLRVGGTVVAYASGTEMTPTLPFYPLMFKNIRLHMALCYHLSVEDHRRGEEALYGWMEKGWLSHAIAERFPFDNAVAAHQAVEKGNKLGAVLLEM